MPVHDWTRVDAGIFHDFHPAWTAALRNALNDGLLPRGYYALVEQHAGHTIRDVMLRYEGPGLGEPAWLPPDSDRPDWAEALRRTRRRRTIAGAYRTGRRSLAIRNVGHHYLVALLEIVSPANKDGARRVRDLADKAVSALDYGPHLLIVDLLPPGPHDPTGIHGAILRRLEPDGDPYEPPADEPLTLASYAARAVMDVHLEHLAVGAPLPEMPLFLRPDLSVHVPLEPTYQAATRGMPAYWRDVLEGRSTHGP
jgi:hypothetical protein